MAGRVGLEQRQLRVRGGALVVELSDERRAFRDEHAAMVAKGEGVEHEESFGQRIEAESDDRRIDEADPREDLHLESFDRRALDQAADRGFADERVPGDRVHDAVGAASQLEQARDDRVVDGVEGPERLVQVIE